MQCFQFLCSLIATLLIYFRGNIFENLPNSETHAKRVHTAPCPVSKFPLARHPTPNCFPGAFLCRDTCLCLTFESAQMCNFHSTAVIFCFSFRRNFSLDLGPQQFLHRKLLRLRYSAKQSLPKLQVVLWQQRLSLEILYPRAHNRPLLGKLYPGSQKKTRVSKKAQKRTKKYPRW